MDKVFQENIITPSETPLGGWVHLTVGDNGNYRIHFHMHCSNKFVSFNYYLRAYLSAPDCPTIVFAHKGHVSGVSDEGDPMVGNHPLLGMYASQLKARGRLRVVKEYTWGGPIGVGLSLFSDIKDAAGSIGAIVAATPDAIEGFASILGPGATIGVLGGALVFVAGTALGGPAGSVLIQSTIAGVAVGAATNALVKSRPLNAGESQFCRRVFGRTLPVERVVLTNLLGLGERGFTAPGVDGKIYCNIGDAALRDPLHYTAPAAPGKLSPYAAPGQLFVHELTHAWQIAHASFIPGIVCEGILNQAKNTLQGNLYNPGPAGPDWSRFNLEQQASIVDQWFAGQSDGKRSAYRPMDSEHPYYRYVRDDILGGTQPEGAPFRLGVVQAITEPGNRTGLYLERKNGNVFTKFFPDSKKPESWSDWLPLDAKSFPQGATVSVVSPRVGETALYVVGREGNVWNKFFPDGRKGGNWSDWFPHGNNTFPLGSTVTAVSAGPGATSLYVLDKDEQVWTNFFPARPDQWSGWLKL